MFPLTQSNRKWISSKCVEGGGGKWMNKYIFIAQTFQLLNKVYKVKHCIHINYWNGHLQRKLFFFLFWSEEHFGLIDWILYTTKIYYIVGYHVIYLAVIDYSKVLLSHCVKIFFKHQTFWIKHYKKKIHSFSSGGP